ncbi:VOC family protein [Nonomuraea sp. NN258]|uniref:VOC family protein n=1 Tax=Nonomuraea antri TaxID=2730852 RepID=UPI001568B2F5|nr:VOC family protein [Nonomuraea antri]NRQ34258.1 VOC family protein [Nonomuraea antri]
MAETIGHPDGAPCWAQLLTRDAGAAERFYAGLFGWECRDRGGWAMCLLGGRPVAAITPDPAADRAAWTVHLATADLTAALARVEAGGGKPLEGPVQGTVEGHAEGYALVADPAGATFALLQPGAFAGAGALAEPGAMSWAEVNVPDGSAADAFYTALFSYEHEQVPGGIDYAVYSAGGRAVSGRLLMDEHWAGVPPHWMIYFDVADLAAATAKVAELGGAVPVPAFDTPHGRLAVVNDPTGGFLTLRQPAGPEHA